MRILVPKCTNSTRSKPWFALYDINKKEVEITEHLNIRTFFRGDRTNGTIRQWWTNPAITFDNDAVSRAWLKFLGDRKLFFSDEATMRSIPHDCRNPALREAEILEVEQRKVQRESLRRAAKAKSNKDSEVINVNNPTTSTPTTFPATMTLATFPAATHPRSRSFLLMCLPRHLRSHSHCQTYLHFALTMRQHTEMIMVMLIIKPVKMMIRIVSHLSRSIDRKRKRIKR